MFDERRACHLNGMRKTARFFFCFLHFLLQFHFFQNFNGGETKKLLDASVDT